MKKGICLNCVPGDDPQAQLRIAKDTGFDGVEIGAVEQDESVLRLKDAADKIGLEIPSIMGGPHWSHPLSSPDPDVRKHCRDSLAQSLRHAHLIGANTVLLVPGVVNDQATYEEAWQRSVHEVRALAAVATEQQVTLAIENVWNKFLLSPLEFNLFLDEVGSPQVQAYFDCGNILSYGLPQHWIQSLGNRIAKIHVKGFTVFPNAAFPFAHTSDVPWAACREAWRRIGYDDYLTVEIGPEPDNELESIRRYSDELDRIIEGTV